MADQQLLDYIRTSLQGGTTPNEIKQGLLTAGWTQEQVEEAFKLVSIPKPPSPASSPVKNFVVRKRYSSPYSILLAFVLSFSLLILSQNAVVDILDRFAPDENRFTSSKEYQDYLIAVKDYEKNAPKLSEYSDTFTYNVKVNEWDKSKYDERSLLYDKYQTIYKENTASPSYRMILNAIIVLPFWVITFFLFISLKEDRKRYGPLLGAYYITSGWLLIFLFFNVARYIWYSNTVLGVYIVFGMLAIILTGAVWGVQKYRHSLDN